MLFLQRFSAVIMRIRDPKTTALMFASGKVVGSSQTLALSRPYNIACSSCKACCVLLAALKCVSCVSGGHRSEERG